MYKQAIKTCTDSLSLKKTTYYPSLFSEQCDIDKTMLSLKKTTYYPSLFSEQCDIDETMLILALNTTISYSLDKHDPFQLVGCLDFGIYFYRIQSDMHDCLGFKWFQLTTHGKVEQRHHEVKVKPIVKEGKEASGKERKEANDKQTKMKYLFQY